MPVERRFPNVELSLFAQDGENPNHRFIRIELTANNDNPGPSAADVNKANKSCRGCIFDRSTFPPSNLPYSFGRCSGVPLSRTDPDPQAVLEIRVLRIPDDQQLTDVISRVPCLNGRVSAQQFRELIDQ